MTYLKKLLINDVRLLERMQLVDCVWMIVAVFRIYLESFLLQSFNIKQHSISRL